MNTKILIYTVPDPCYKIQSWEKSYWPEFCSDKPESYSDEPEGGGRIAGIGVGTVIAVIPRILRYWIKYLKIGFYA
jgi:hypothetical protein